MIKSVLLAAGRGTRLLPLTEVVAKPALPLLDRPLGAFGLTSLLATAPPVLVNVSHLPDKVVEALRPYGEFEVLDEGPEGYGTGGTLAAIRERVDRRLVTYNADLLSDVDVAELVGAHIASGASATVAIREVTTGADFVVEGDRAVAFVDRRRRGGVAGGQFLGVAVYEKEALERIPDRRPVGVGETLLADLAERGRLGAHVHRGYRADVGTPLSYLLASNDLLTGVGPRSLEPWPGEVLVVEGGLAYRGPGAVVSDESLGPGAIVLAGANVHPGARIRDSIVWPNEDVPEIQLEGTIWARGRPLPNPHPFCS